MEKPLLEVRSVDLYYGSLQVVWDASLVVPEGSVVAIVGPNGAGKTTLLKGIYGMVRPKKGRSSLTALPFQALPLRRL